MPIKYIPCHNPDVNRIRPQEKIYSIGLSYWSYAVMLHLNARRLLFETSKEKDYIWRWNSLLQDIFRTTVEAKLTYATPAWSGFCSVGDRVRLNAFLRRCTKLGYRDRGALDIDTLFTDCDERIFNKIKYNSSHILQQFLPNRLTVNYNLRTRSHNKTLIPKTSYLNERNFLIRNLYKDCY